MGLPLPEAGLTQAVFPNIFSTMETVYPSAWAGPARLVDTLVLTSQGAFAKCVSQCFKVPPLSTLSASFNSLLHLSIFPEAGAWQGM